jgi:gamma-glutamyl hercynylcysteine S-oxide hydrolase
MCRHLAYLGPPVSLAELVLDPPHSLLSQSYAPNDMRGGGTVNADGFGLGWYPPGHANGRVRRYRRSVPMWTDASLRDLAAGVRSGAVLAAVRNATAGMPVGEGACAPFTDGRWLFSHNGRVEAWPGSVAALASVLPVTDLMTLDAPTDAALLWALVRHRLRSGASPLDAMASVVVEVASAAPASRLNLLLTDGERVVGTTWTHALWTRQTPGAVAVASEPWDPADPSWQEVPDRHAVLATADAVTTHPLDAVATHRLDAVATHRLDAVTPPPLEEK